MKKLMVMLAAVATAFGLFADEPATGGVIGTPTSLEELPTGLDALWSDATLGAIKNYEAEGVTPYAYDETEGAKNTRFPQFSDQTNFLHVSSTFTAPLYRWNAEGGTAAELENDGTCFDTLAELVGVEDDEVPALASGAKLAVWLKATTADEVETPETNLYVTAGCWADSAIATKTYKIANISVEAGTWHRVTVKTVKNAFDSSIYGFVVYIDGVLVQAVQADYDEIGFTVISATGTSYYNKCALFPSATADDTFVGVGFAGNGNVDDISVTWGDQAPAFTAPAVEASFVAETGLKSFQYRIGEGDDWTTVTVATDPLTFEIEDGQTVYFNENGYTFDTTSKTTSYTFKKITAVGFVPDTQSGGYTLDEGDVHTLTIGVEATPYLVTVVDAQGNFNGYTTEEAAIAAIDADDFAGAITIPEMDGFAYADGAKGSIAFNQGDTITVDDQGVWFVTNAMEIVVSEVTAGADIRVVGDVDVSGVIAGKLTIVEGDCTVSDELEINNEGWESAGDEGMLFALGGFACDPVTEQVITLGEHGLLQTVNKQTYQGAKSIFEEPEEGKKIKETEIKEEETVVAYEYTLVALGKVRVTVNNTGAIVTGVATGDYTEGETVTFTVAPAEGFETPITVTGAESTGTEGEYTFTVGTEAITITVTATAKDYVAQVTSGTDTFKFETAEAALAKVWDLEQNPDNFPITVTALVDDLEVTNPETSEKITLGEGATITITAAGWAFTGDVEGEVTLAPGKSITVPTGLTNFKVNAPDGYAVVPQATMDTVTYTVAAYVAQIDETKYTTLAAAVAAVTADQTITLLNTVTLDAQLLLNKGFAFTIAGNGQTITAADVSAIDDLIKISGDGTAVTFNGVTFDNIDCAGCVIHGDGDGTFVLTNCTFTNCDVVKGTAGRARIVYCINLAGGYTISGCTFEDNTSEGCIVGHNLSNGGSVVLIENTLFKNNTYADVGLFYVTGSNAENCQIIGNTFEGNKVPAEYAGKASILYASCAITIKDNLFKDNVFATTATNSKVGVIVLGSKAIGSIVNNNAFVGSDYTGVAEGQNIGDIFTGTAANIDGNYFDGGAAPTYASAGNVYQDEGSGTIAATYLESYTAQADGRGIEAGTPVVDTTVATLTITKGENVTAVVVTNADGAAVTSIPVSETAVGAHFFIADAMTVAVDLANTTFAENYELDEANSTLTATMTDDATITVNAKLVEFAITFTDADAWTNVVSTAYGATPAPTEEIPLKEGKTFKGWDPEIVAATADATYTAVYTANVYTVTFEKGDADGGTDVDPITFSYGDTLTAPECTWTYTGHEFVAWTNLEADVAAIPAGAPLPTEVNDDYTLTALWVANAPTPVPPGEDIKPDPGDDANKINNDPETKAKYLKAPGGVETTATYLNCFDAVAGETAGTVKFVLNANGTNTVKAAEAVADTAALEKVLAATGDSTTLTLTGEQVLKGFYYSLKQGGEVQSIDFAQPSDANKLGGKDTIEFTLGKDPTSGFYQMIVTPAPVVVIEEHHELGTL